MKYPLVGKGNSKKQMPYCNDKDRLYLTNLKGCLLWIGVKFIKIKNI